MPESNFWVKTIMYHAVLEPRLDFKASYYHSIYKNALEKQLKYCKTNFSILHPNDYLESLEGTKKFPKKALLVTFDDGYQNIFDLALPILKKLKIPAIVFFNTKNLDAKGWLWFSRLKALEQRKQLDWGALSKPLESSSLENIEQQLKVLQAPSIADASSIEREQFNGASINSIKAGIDSGYIIPGGHTVDHVKLIFEAPKTAYQQIEQNKQQLEQLLNVPIDFFAYPEGLVNTNIARIVEEIGYKAAFAVHQPEVDFPKELYRFHIPRIGIFRDNFWYFLAKVHQIDQSLKALIS